MYGNIYKLQGFSKEDEETKPESCNIFVPADLATLHAPSQDHHRNYTKPSMYSLTALRLT